VNAPLPGAAFYCVADDRYFLGAVGLVNSLRLHGHREPVFVLDVGLTAEQRELLTPEVDLVDGSGVDAPWLAKTLAPLDRPAEVTVLIDADMIVTRPLGELIATAAEGNVVAFRNDIDRHVAAWGELLELGPLRREPYLSSGLVLLGGEAGTEALRLLDDRQRRVDPERSIAGRGEPGYPFLYPEQDVLNAILATRIPQERVVALPNRLAANPPYRGLRVTDLAGVRCAHPDGAEPYVLHQFVRKPWLEPMYHGVYPRLLARLLLGPGIAIRVPEDAVPRRMRGGAGARAERLAVNAYDLGRWYFAERLPAWIRSRRGAAGP
jgi:hypothetical protein